VTPDKTVEIKSKDEREHHLPMDHPLKSKKGKSPEKAERLPVTGGRACRLVLESRHTRRAAL
jgi:hypothetical protein